MDEAADSGHSWSRRGSTIRTKSGAASAFLPFEAGQVVLIELNQVIKNPAVSGFRDHQTTPEAFKSDRPYDAFTFCSVCKRRKLKCDEARPVCGQCQKSSRSCDFPDDTIFRIVNRPAGSRDGQGFPGLNNDDLSFDKDQIWIDVPRDLSFVPPSLTGESPTTPASPEEPVAATREPQRKQPRMCYVESEPEVFHGLEMSDKTRTPSGPAKATPVPALTDQRSTISGELKGETEMLSEESDNVELLIRIRLMRYFKEGLAQWMDLFDTSAYYANVVPIRATCSPLLKSSICALSAKHMHRCRGADGITYNLPMAPFDVEKINWLAYSTEYYHDAIGHLQAAVRNAKIGPDSSSTDRERECIFTAIAILSTYELIDQPGIAWRAHLSALPLFGPSSNPETAASVEEQPLTICRPVFWSLARQDFLCAFISETQTRLMLDDSRLWRSAGLTWTPEKPAPYLPEDQSGPVVMGSANNGEEDKRGNEIIWLLSKIMNYLTQGDSLVPEDYARPSKERCPVGVTQEKMLDKWHTLNAALQDWFLRLPPSFTPTTRVTLLEEKYRSYEDAYDCVSLFDQIWYDVPICAAAMVSYHMARILLLLNCPHGSTAIWSSITARVRSYGYTLKDATYHAREICGIILANPTHAVLLHALEPLFVAGQVLRTYGERTVVIKLFRDVEKNVGWSTSYHVEKLQREWAEGGDWIVDEDIYD